jgi:putative colanic acid biosynthesis acetyltransferase WcaF
LGEYTPGAPFWKQFLWYYIGAALLESYWLPWSGTKVAILRLFGATVGQNVRIKPGVKVKFPWRLTLGDYVWLGEKSWLDNLAQITIESHVCISQDVYLCTGNHDWSHPHFSLVPAPIIIKQGSWLAARATVGPGVTIGRGAVLCLGSVASHSLEAMAIYAGNPAKMIKTRSVKADLSH